MQTRQNEVIKKVLLSLAELVREKDISYIKISEVAKEEFGIDVSPYQIRSVANGKFKENKVVESLDKYIDAVLKVVGVTDTQFLAKTINYLDRTTLGPKVEMDKDLKRFVENPDKYSLSGICL